MRRGNGAI